MKNEPVIIGGVSVGAIGAALIQFLTSWGVPITEQQGEATITLAVLVVPIVASLIVRHFTVPAGNVVERNDNGRIVAGQASELPTGTAIRSAGALTATTISEPEPFDPDEYDDPDADPDADDAELAADPFSHLNDAEPVGEHAAQ